MRDAAEQTSSSKNAEVVERLLRGAVDLHCHSGPSIMPRSLTHLEAIREAEAVGMRAIMFKDHFYSATAITQMLAEEGFARTGIALLAGVPLNNALGGLNPYAVEHELKLGARMVWMPTLSALNHQRRAFRHNLAAKLKGGRMMPFTGITILTDRGELRDEAKAIIDLVVEHDCILSGGHLHISEMWVLFREAKARGARRLLVSHPTHWIDATLTDLKELGELGVYMEHCACQLIECRSRKFTAQEMKSFIDAGGIEHTILGSDLGQPYNPRPVEGFREVIGMCLDLGYSEAEVRRMVSTNACELVGLDPFPEPAASPADMAAAS